MRYTIVREDEITDADRAALGALLADSFSADDPEQESYLRAHAHWGDRPFVRVIAHCETHIVGQQSVFQMGPGVIGLGDIAVSVSHRGMGIARELVNRVLRLCRDQVVLTRTLALRSVFTEHGFRPVQLPQLVPDPHWIGRGDVSRVGRLELNDV
jgi:GNAT superfamily N-acetyltransferase